LKWSSNSVIGYRPYLGVKLINAMKYKCANCTKLFENSDGESYDWRNNKDWFMSCPMCSARLNVKAQPLTFSLKKSLIILVWVMFVFGSFIWYIYFRHIEETQGYSHTVNMIIAIVFVLAMLFKSKIWPEKSMQTYLYEKK